VKLSSTNFEAVATSGGGMMQQHPEVMNQADAYKLWEHTEWSISGSKGTANVLGINPSTLRFRIKKHKIRKDL